MFEGTKVCRMFAKYVTKLIHKNKLCRVTTMGINYMSATDFSPALFFRFFNTQLFCIGTKPHVHNNIRIALVMGRKATDCPIWPCIKTAEQPIGKHGLL